VFPNLRQVWFSSRIHTGYSVNPNHAEPNTGYDNGLAVRNVVADAVAGQTPLWAAWGPYLWADGESPRSDGLTWICDDFESDGVHPGFSGEDKVAAMLLETSRRWPRRASPWDATLRATIGSVPRNR
jgi:hypothetical protein